MCKSCRTSKRRPPLHPTRPPPSLTHISTAPWDQRKPTYSHIIRGCGPARSGRDNAYTDKQARHLRALSRSVQPARPPRSLAIIDYSILSILSPVDIGRRARVLDVIVTSYPVSARRDVAAARASYSYGFSVSPENDQRECHVYQSDNSQEKMLFPTHTRWNINAEQHQTCPTFTRQHAKMNDPVTDFSHRLTRLHRCSLYRTANFRGPGFLMQTKLIPKTHKKTQFLKCIYCGQLILRKIGKNAATRCQI